MHFSNPYTPPAEALLMSTDAWIASPPASGAAVLGCAMNGWAIGADYLNTMKDASYNGWTITVDDSWLGAAELTAAVVSGACDLVLFDSDMSGGELAIYEEVAVTDHQVGGVGYMTDGTSSNSECILSRINEGLTTIRDDGRLEALFADYTDSLPGAELTFEHTNSVCTVDDDGEETTTCYSDADCGEGMTCTFAERKRHLRGLLFGYHAMGYCA